MQVHISGHSDRNAVKLFHFTNAVQPDGNTCHCQFALLFAAGICGVLPPKARLKCNVQLLDAGSIPFGAAAGVQGQARAGPGCLATGWAPPSGTAVPSAASRAYCTCLAAVIFIVTVISCVSTIFRQGSFLLHRRWGQGLSPCPVPTARCSPARCGRAQWRNISAPSR